MNKYTIYIALYSAVELLIMLIYKTKLIHFVELCSVNLYLFLMYECLMKTVAALVLTIYLCLISINIDFTNTFNVGCLVCMYDFDTNPTVEAMLTK